MNMTHDPAAATTDWGPFGRPLFDDPSTRGRGGGGGGGGGGPRGGGGGGRGAQPRARRHRPPPGGRGGPRLKMGNNR
jgi:hypothetical protein